MLDSVLAHRAAVAGVGVVLVLAAWTHYLVAIARETVPRRPVAHCVALVLGLGIGVVSVLPPHVYDTARIAATAMFGVNLLLVALFLWLLSQSPQPQGALIVSVGDTIAPFSSTTDTGKPFESSELAGKRVLLKFFRGHW